MDHNNKLTDELGLTTTKVQCRIDCVSSHGNAVFNCVCPARGMNGSLNNHFHVHLLLLSYFSGHFWSTFLVLYQSKGVGEPQNRNSHVQNRDSKKKYHSGSSTEKSTDSIYPYLEKLNGFILKLFRSESSQRGTDRIF